MGVTDDCDWQHPNCLNFSRKSSNPLCELLPEGELSNTSHRMKIELGSTMELRFDIERESGASRGWLTSIQNQALSTHPLVPVQDGSPNRAKPGGIPWHCPSPLRCQSRRCSAPSSPEGAMPAVRVPAEGIEARESPRLRSRRPPGNYAHSCPSTAERFRQSMLHRSTSASTVGFSAGIEKAERRFRARSDATLAQ